MLFSHDLIYVYNSGLKSNILLKCLSNLQYKHGSIDIIIDNNFDNVFITKLINVIIFILQQNYIYNISIYTQDKRIFQQIKQTMVKYNLDKTRLSIKPLMLFKHLNNNQLVNLESFNDIFVIENDKNIIYYNTEIFTPILNISL
jgi:hypothetical protein